MKSKTDLSYLKDLEIILQEELLFDLTGKSLTDMTNHSQRYSKEIHFLYEVVDCLRGSYNDEGIRRWFQRGRSQLEGKSPLEYLGSDWNPDEEEARHVLELAKYLETT